MNVKIKLAFKLIYTLAMCSMLLLMMRISTPSSVARHERFARDVTYLRGFIMDTRSLKGKKDVPPEDMALKDVTEDLTQYRFNRYSLYNHESFPDENNTVIQTQMLTLTQPLSS